MNYQKIYDSLIARAQNRSVDGYIERHHIVPKALGGSDDQTNLVDLKSREHFIAHLLLAKIYGGKMIKAAFLMSSRKKFGGRKYEYLKEQFAQLVSSDTERAKKISRSNTGKKRTNEHVANWKASRIANDSFKRTPEMNAKTSASLSGELNPMFGKTHEESAKHRIIEANKQKVECPHCEKVGGIAIMKRWHFDNCKNKR